MSSFNNSQKIGMSKQESMLNTVQMTNKFSEDEYNNYIDSSDMVVEYYKKNQIDGLENQFLKIDNWLNQDIKNPEDNQPMVIVASEGVGKKTTLVKWMEFHQQNQDPKCPDIILPHFATTGGNNSNFYFAIYQFLIKLRDILDVKQKVELLEEKLRSYFSYWLGVCHDCIERQIIDDKEKIYKKVILVFEGIDHFVDQQTGKEADINFWLPRFFPLNIRVICTVDKHSEAFAYFQRRHIEPMYIQVDQGIIQEQIDKCLSQESLINDDLKQKHLEILQQYPQDLKIYLFISIYSSFFLPNSDEFLSKDDIDSEILNRIYKNMDYERVQNIESHEELYEIMIDTYRSQQIISSEGLTRLLQIICLAQKGLTLAEIQCISGISDDEWKSFMICFKNYFIFYKDLWILNNDSFKKYICLNFLNTNSVVSEIHLRIADEIERITPNSIRKLEEQTFHLFKNGTEKGLFKLKETISTIENFLLLFNPNCKYDLCRYWQALEQKGFDPVVEYNKAIEGFEMHYHPSPEDVFRIIVQISRFLKEFSDFENYGTPEFRHPPIRGTIEELNDIGLLKELNNLGIYLNSVQMDKEKMEDLFKDYSKQRKEKLDSQFKKLKNGKKDSDMLKIDQSMLDPEQKKLEKKRLLRQRQKEKYEQLREQTSKKVEWEAKKQESGAVINRILKKLEQLNVDIPVNRQLFREHYVQNLLKIMREDDPQIEEPIEKQQGKMKTQLFKKSQAEQLDLENQIQQKKIKNEEEITDQFLKLHKNDAEFQVKKLNNNGEEQNNIITYQQLKDYYNLKQSDSTNYYYKRWLWIQYPWACMSLKCDYSSKLETCFSSETQYMSVSDEKKFTKQALKIAIEAKLKKQSMYQKKNPNEQSSIIKANMSRISHKSSLPQLQHHRSATQIKGNNSILGKSQTLSRIDINESQEGLPRLRNQNNKSISNQEYNKKLGGNRNDSVQFFITEEYTSVPNINRELEKTQRSPVRGKGKVQKALNSLEYEGTSTSVILQKTRKYKDKSQFFDPLPIIDSRKRQGILPKLKNSMQDHSVKEIYILERQNLDMKGTLNMLVAQNKQMANKLKHLKQLQSYQNEGLDGTQVQKATQKICDVEKLIEESQNKYYFNVMQIERLKAILKISDDNKKQNQEWIRHLNYLLTNISKMIKWEQEGIQSTKKETDELIKIREQYLEAFREKMQNHETLINQIKNNLMVKKDIDGLFGRSDIIIEKSACSQIDKMKSDQESQDYQRRMKERQDLNQMKQKDIENQLEEQRQQYEQLQEIIDIMDPNYYNSEAFQNFLAGQEKQAKFNAILLEREDQIYDLKKQITYKQNKLDTLRKAQNQNKLKDDGQVDASRRTSNASQVQQMLSQKLNESKKQQEQQQQDSGKNQDEQNKSSQLQNEQKEKENQQQQEQEQQQQEDDDNQQQNMLSMYVQKEDEDKDTDSEFVEELPSDLEELQEIQEKRASENRKLEQIRLALVVTLQTAQNKLKIKQGKNVKETINFDEDLLCEELEKKLQVIQENMGQEEFENFMQGNFDKNQMYRGIIDEVSDYGYDEQRDGQMESDSDDDIKNRLQQQSQQQQSVMIQNTQRG